MFPGTGEIPAPRITGQLLHIHEHRKVAIYMRSGAVGVAEFTDNGAELVDAATWFSSSIVAAGLPRYARKRALDSAGPIPPDIARRIEALHAVNAPRTTLETSMNASVLAVLRVAREIAYSIRQWRDYRQQLIESGHTTPISREVRSRG
jgi:hypothetical protein